MNSILGSPQADSWINLVMAEAYFATRYNSETWTTATDEVKPQALIGATNDLEKLNIGGRRYWGDPLSWSQKLRIPVDRSGGIYDAKIFLWDGPWKSLKGAVESITAEVPAVEDDPLTLDVDETVPRVPPGFTTTIEAGRYRDGEFTGGSVKFTSGPVMFHVVQIASFSATGAILVEWPLDSADDPIIPGVGDTFEIIGPLYPQLIEAVCEQAIHLLDGASAKRAQAIRDGVAVSSYEGAREEYGSRLGGTPTPNIYADRALRAIDRWLVKYATGVSERGYRRSVPWGRR